MSKSTAPFSESTLSQGTHLGETALFKDLAPLELSRISQAATLQKIDRDSFFYFEQDPAERVERRIARTLLRLVRQSGRKVSEEVLIDIPLSRQDLAEMNGTTLFTVSRTLSQWEQQGLIQAGRERIVIVMPHGLVSIAEDLPVDFGKEMDL